MSSKSGENVSELFEDVARDVFEAVNSAERIERIRWENMKVRLWVPGKRYRTCC